MSIAGEGQSRPPGDRPARTAQAPRTAKQVIDQAIKENKWSATLLFILLMTFAIAGLATLVLGIIREEGTIALAGGISSILLWPTISHARQIRRENIALRMLEEPLSRAETAAEASEILKEFFVDTFIRRSSNP